MYTALYRTQRPEVFEEILGQEHIVKILRNQIATGGVSHAYLFCGTRGTGKTTTARILAKGVNCLSDGERPCGACDHCKAIKEGSFMDVVEIDAASNNGVENIRELRESVKYPPSLGRKKVYIIDEVHMLSTGAFNALLKTLEEPPEHVMFILATTEPQKLPATILSRCMRLDFRRVSQKVIAENMRKLCAERGVELTDGAAGLLADCADGSVRDGLSVLDQVLAGGDKLIDRDKVLEYVGAAGEDFFAELTELVSSGKSAEALLLLNDALQEGKDVRQMMKDWVSHYRSLLIAKFVKDAGDMLNMSAENLNRLEEQSGRISVEEIDLAVTRLSKTINDARWSANPRVLMELAIVAIAAGGEQETRFAPARQKSAGRSEQSVRSVQNVQQYDAPQYREDARADETFGIPEAVRDVNASQAAWPKPSGDEQGHTVSADAAGARDGAGAEAETDTRKEGPYAGSENIGAVYSEAERAALWRRIFEEGEGSAGSFNLIRSGTTLESVTDDSFVVVACSDFTKRYVEQKRTQLEGFMEEQTGRRRRLKCRLKGEGEKTGEPDRGVEALAKEAENILGINIDIE